MIHDCRMASPTISRSSTSQKAKLFCLGLALASGPISLPARTATSSSCRSHTARLTRYSASELNQARRRRDLVLPALQFVRPAEQSFLLGMLQNEFLQVSGGSHEHISVLADFAVLDGFGIFLQPFLDPVRVHGRNF